MSTGTTGFYRDRDPLKDKRINEMSDHIVGIESEIYHIKERLDNSVKQNLLEELYDKLLDLSKLTKDLEKNVVAFDKIITLDGNRITENEAKIELTSEQIKLSVEKLEKDLLSKALKESAAYFEMTAESIISEVTQIEFDAIGRQIKNARSLITQTAESITQMVSKEDYNSLISQTAEEILLLVENIGEMETNISEISIRANEIESRVTQNIEDINGALTNYSTITQTATLIEARITQERSDIDGKFQNYSTTTQTFDFIETRVGSERSSIDGKFENYSTLTQTASLLESKVSKDGVISAIRQSFESVKIQASKIDLVGANITIGMLDTSAQSTINGKLNATEYNASDIANKLNNSSVTINAARINLNGALTISDFTANDRNTINNASSNASSAKSITDAWKYGNTTEINGAVIRTGTLNAVDVNLTGHINAVTGQIGDFKITTYGMLLDTPRTSGGLIMLTPGVRIQLGSLDNPYWGQGDSTDFEFASGLFESRLGLGIVSTASGGGWGGNYSFYSRKGHIYLRDCLELGSTASYAPKFSGHLRWVMGSDGNRHIVITDNSLFPE